MDEGSIAGAVDECLSLCAKASTPPPITIEGFCRELVVNHSWTDDDAKELGQRVTQILIQRALGQ